MLHCFSTNIPIARHIKGIQMKLRIVLLLLLMLLVSLSACSPISPTNIIPTPTPMYSLAGGGSCVRLGSHPQLPYTNIQVSHDTYLAHSEPMLAENPLNPLN